MQSFPQTVVIRHRRENLKKCSLRGLESRPGFHFLRFPLTEPFDLSNLLLLSFDGPVLTPKDSNRSLLVIDATWRYAERMVRQLDPNQKLERRSLPLDFQTAYPRRQDDCLDPERGLASIEAIYVAYRILGRDTTNLLDNYHWKDAFLQKNGLSFP